MFKRSSLALSLSSLVLVAGCGWGSKTEETKAVEGASTTQAAVKVINVLDKAMFDDAHIQGSVNVDLAKLKEEAANWNKNDTYVFYCSNYMCTASVAAAEELSKMGFANVIAFEGGMAEWYQLSKTDATFAVEGAAQQEYLTQVVAKNEAAVIPAGVKIVSAQDLKKLMTDAGLLKAATESVK